MKTVDKDVVVIFIGAFNKFIAFNQNISLWIEFGSGKNLRYFCINKISENLGCVKSRALPMFHAITGCDTTSSFLGKGKKTAWNAWSAYPEATNAFVYFIENAVDEDITTINHFSIIERFVVIMYDREREETFVNDARLNLFTKKNRPLDNIPPTKVYYFY